MTASRCYVLSLALLAALAGGCNPAAKAVGKWEVDVDKVQAGFPVIDKMKLFATLAASASVRVEVEIKSDGTWRDEFGLGSQTVSEGGTWRYSRTEGDTVVLLAKLSSGGDEREFKLTFVDDDHADAAGLFGSQTIPIRRKQDR